MHALCELIIIELSLLCITLEVFSNSGTAAVGGSGLQRKKTQFFPSVMLQLSMLNSSRRASPGFHRKQDGFVFLIKKQYLN